MPIIRTGHIVSGTFFLLFLFSSTSLIWGQVYDYHNLRFKQYDVTNGMSSSSCAGMYKDDYGFLWVISFYGVSIFNGSSFFNIPLYSSSGTYTLGGTPQGFLQLDKNRMLIVSTGGLYIFYYGSNQVKKLDNIIVAGTGEKPELLGFDGGNEILLIKYGKIIYRFNRQMEPEGTFECSDEQKNVIVKSNIPASFFYYAAGNYLVGINKTTAVKDTIIQLAGVKDGIAVCGLYQGNYIIATTSGILQVSSRLKKISRQAVVPVKQKGLFFTPRCSIQDTKGNYWIGGNTGLLLYLPATNTLLPVEGIASTAAQEKIDFNIVNDILTDGSNLFIATVNAGLFVYDKSNIDFVNYYVPGTNSSVLSVAVSNSVLCATNPAGIISFAVQKPGERNVSTGRRFAVGNEKYKDIVQIENIDKDHLWVIFKEDFKLAVLLTKDMSLINQALPVDSVTASYFRKQYFRFPNPDKRPQIKKINESLFYFTAGNKLFTVTGTVQQGFSFTLTDTVAPNLYFTALSKMSTGQVLAATNGLYIFEIINNRLYKIYAPAAPPLQLPVRGMEKGTRGDLFLVTPNGLYQLNKYYMLQNHITGSANGLLSDILYAAAIDSNNILWMSTNGGVCAYNTDAACMYSFSSANTMFNREFNTRCVTKDPAGNIYFGGVSGVSVIKSNQFNADTSRGKLYFSEIVNSDSVLYQGLIPGPALQNGHFSYRQNSFSFTVQSISYRAAGKGQIKYLLEGGSNYWNHVGADNKIIFTGLAPGNYTLKVKETLSVNDEGGVPISYSFVITKPLWLRGWVIALAIFAFAGSLVLLVTYFMRKKMERQRMKASLQIALKNERERISQELHDDLGSGLTSIRLLSKSVISRQNSDTTPGMLKNISKISGELIDQMSEIIWVLNNVDDTLNGLLAHIRIYMAEYLSRIGRDDIKLVVHNYIDYPCKIANTERRNLLLVAKETFHNMIKHSGATSFSIECTELREHVVITISDNGKGLPGELPAHGNGLQNIRKRIAAIKGTIRFESNNGTQIIIELPNKKPTV